MLPGDTRSIGWDQMIFCNSGEGKKSVNGIRTHLYYCIKNQEQEDKKIEEFRENQLSSFYLFVNTCEPRSFADSPKAHTAPDTEIFHPVKRVISIARRHRITFACIDRLFMLVHARFAVISIIFRQESRITGGVLILCGYIKNVFQRPE